MAKNRCEEEIRDVLVSLKVIRGLIEVGLGHTLEVVVVNGLGLVEAHPAQSLIAWHRDHLITIEYHCAVGHVKLKLLLHLVKALLFLIDLVSSLSIFLRLARVRLDHVLQPRAFLMAHVD